MCYDEYSPSAKQNGMTDTITSIESTTRCMILADETVQ